MTDAANVMFAAARHRVYIQNKPVQAPDSMHDEDRELDDAWDVLDEIEGRTPAPRSTRRNHEAEGWKPWMPSGMKPVLEELPKWRLLEEVLDEIEQTMMSNPAPRCMCQQPFALSLCCTHVWVIVAPGSNVTLIMAADHQTCGLIREFLSTKHMDASAPGRHLLETRLRTYLYWKQLLMDADSSGPSKKSAAGSGDSAPAKDSQFSEGLKKKDAQRDAARNNRRRVRGGAPTPSVASRGVQEAGEAPVLDLDPDGLAELQVCTVHTNTFSATHVVHLATQLSQNSN